MRIDDLGRVPDPEEVRMISSPRAVARLLVVFGVSALVLVAACSGDGPRSPAGPEDPAAQPFDPAAGPPPEVHATVPPEVPRDTTLDIRVLGSGFDDGSQVVFELDGSPSGEVRTNSTRFESDSVLVAEVRISGLADVARYDVAVTTASRKRGVGIEVFVVIVATNVGSLEGGVNSRANDVNENGEVVGAAQIGFPGEPGFDGFHAIYWHEGGLEDMGRGFAFGISGECAVGDCRVTGFRDSRPILWQKEGGAWTSLELPTEGPFGSAWAISPQGDRVVGNMALDGPCCASVAVIWIESGGVWTPTPLSEPADEANAYGLNGVGQVVGRADRLAWVWTQSGDGWTATELAALPGDTEALARDINDAGDVVGESGPLGGPGRAVVWRRTATGWGPPIELVPQRSTPPLVINSVAAGINNGGWIVGVFDLDEEFPLGQHAFLWINDVIIDLGSFEGRGTLAARISDRNHIAGTNTDRALLWTF